MSDETDAKKILAASQVPTG